MAGPVGRKALRKLRNARRHDVLRVVTRNAGRVVKDERHLRGRRGFDAMVTLNDLEISLRRAGEIIVVALRSQEVK